jgi:hypothetical protein
MKTLPALLAFSLASLAGCAIMAVGSDFSPRADFSGYRTFAWETSEDLATGDPRLDDNPFFAAHLRELVERELTAKGLESADGAGADLALHFHLSVERKVDVYEVDEELGYTSPERRAGGYDEGMLLIDFADTAANRIVWRGWARVDFTGVVDDRERLGELMDEAVTRILARFPPA